MEVKLNCLKNHCGVYQTVNGNFTVKAFFLDKYDERIGFILESDTNSFIAGDLEVELEPCTNDKVWEKIEVENINVELGAW